MKVKFCLFLATTAHCHDRAAIKIHITHFTCIFNEEFWAAEIQISSIVFRTNINRLAVVLVQKEENKILCIARTDDSTGKTEAEAVKKSLDDWQLASYIISMGFDTTSSNTGVHKGALYSPTTDAEQKPPLDGLPAPYPRTGDREHFQNSLWRYKVSRMHVIQGSDLHWQTKRKVEKMSLFVVFVYLKSWFSASCLTSAASNDLELFRRIDKFKSVHKKVSAAAANVLQRHTWYLTEELVPLALFNEKLPLDDRTHLALKIGQLPLEELDIRKPSLPSIHLKSSQIGPHLHTTKR